MFYKYFLPFLFINSIFDVDKQVLNLDEIDAFPVMVIYVSSYFLSLHVRI
jgi:hypothetical protein